MDDVKGWSRIHGIEGDGWDQKTAQHRLDVMDKTERSPGDLLYHPAGFISNTKSKVDLKLLKAMIRWSCGRGYGWIFTQVVMEFERGFGWAKWNPCD